MSTNGSPPTHADVARGRQRMKSVFQNNLDHGLEDLGKARYRGEDLPTSGGKGLQTAFAVFKEVDRALYYVEWRIKEENILYLFLPPRGQAEFIGGPQRFAAALEQAFRGQIGENAAQEIEADFLTATATGQVLSQNKSRRISGTTSFLLKAHGMGLRPFAEKLLVDKVFDRLDIILEGNYQEHGGR